MSQHSTKTTKRQSATLHAIQTLLELCLDEHARRVEHFDRESWWWLEEAMMAAPVVAAWDGLDEFDDRDQLAYLESMVAEYRLAVFPDPLSDSEALREACPLFADELLEAP